MIVESHSRRQILRLWTWWRVGSVTSGGVEGSGDITAIIVNINVFSIHLKTQNEKGFELQQTPTYYSKEIRRERDG